VSEQFCDVGQGITLCYETFGDPADPPALLVMGLGTQMIAWHEEFCRQLADRGLYVVRFDNRDIGRSTHVEGRPPTVPQLLMRSRRAAIYTLADMADDAAGLLRELGLRPAHAIGASMGGMIAQSLASRHPQAVRSLVSIMSNTGARWSGQPSLRVYSTLLRRAPHEREAFVRHMEGVFKAIGSTGFPRDSEDIRSLAGASYDRDRDPNSAGRQLAAIIASSDRTSELRRISAPTLVIHGSADRLVSPSGGRATAKAIPNAELMIVEGMGHDLPRAIWPRLIDAISGHVQAADAVTGTGTGTADASAGTRAAGEAAADAPVSALAAAVSPPPSSDALS
jgi:pimeloyl-ACP methyl ester carboxylesterase